MKRLLLFAFLTFLSFIVKAQTKDILKKDTINIPQGPPSTTYTMVESEAIFPGGTKEFLNYISKSLNIPNTEYVKGIVYVRFIIDLDGHVIEPAIFKGVVTDGMKKEILRVFNESPVWQPAIQNSKPIKMLYTIPLALN